MKYIKTYEARTLGISVIGYHKSQKLNHMLKADFRLEYSNAGLFGNAIYFTESSNIAFGSGYYCCKFKISLTKPILDMNKKISIDEASKLLYTFNKIYNTNITFDDYKDINEIEDINTIDSIQYGDLFGDDILGWNIHLRDFIQNQLGYNSFMYYQDRWTDFSPEKTDYGRCYGVYDHTKIKYLETL